MTRPIEQFVNPLSGLSDEEKKKELELLDQARRGVYSGSSGTESEEQSPKPEQQDEVPKLGQEEKGGQEEVKMVVEPQTTKTTQPIVELQPNSKPQQSGNLIENIFDKILKSQEQAEQEARRKEALNKLRVQKTPEEKLPELRQQVQTDLKQELQQRNEAVVLKAASEGDLKNADHVLDEWVKKGDWSKAIQAAAMAGEEALKQVTELRAAAGATLGERDIKTLFDKQMGKDGWGREPNEKEVHMIVEFLDEKEFARLQKALRQEQRFGRDTDPNGFDQGALFHSGTSNRLIRDITKACEERQKNETPSASPSPRDGHRGPGLPGHNQTEITFGGR